MSSRDLAPTTQAYNAYARRFASRKSSAKPTSITAKAIAGQETSKASESKTELSTTIATGQDEGLIDTEAESTTVIYPLYSYRAAPSSPALIYIRDEDEANELVQSLKGPLGFDMEWKVSRKKGVPQNPTALLQLCDESNILLIHLSVMRGFPEKVKEVIELPDILKVGANIENDGKKLQQDYAVTPRSILDLGSFARERDLAFEAELKSTGSRAKSKATVISLVTLTEKYLGKTLPKFSRVRTSNWEKTLNDAQQEYAANDVHCSLMIYKKLLEIASASEPGVDPFLYARSL